MSYKHHPTVQKIIDRAAKRRARMKELRERGWTLQRIADKYGLTHERVRQILYLRRSKGVIVGLRDS